MPMVAHPASGQDAPKRVLITGGAGFIGATLAVDLATRHPDWEVVALDSLHRRGSELNLPRLRSAGVSFVLGDVRQPPDIEGVGPFDALLVCSAEPSVMAGVDEPTAFVVHTNLLGAYHCLEAAARHRAQIVFLSTSRVYPIAALSALNLEEAPTRFQLLPDQDLRGASERGIAEDFPLAGARTLYGATKLAAELLIAEYAASFELPTVINRCGVVAGPWQMGKVDQGVFTYWMLAHFFKRPLAYIGFGGAGKQVRDLVHILDLAELVHDQLMRPGHWAGATVNVGGGVECSLSLRETSALCAEITGNELDIGADAATRAGDVPVYISDCQALSAFTDWKPARGPRDTLADIYTWIREHQRLLVEALPA